MSSCSTNSKMYRVASQTARAMKPRGRIIVVDDDPAVLETWGLLLTIAGYETVCFGDPVQALETIAAGCDCVLTDYHMPRMNGVELIRTARGWSKARFLLMTGNVSEAVTEAALAAGACCIVHKPIAPSLVLQKLEAVLR